MASSQTSAKMPASTSHWPISVLSSISALINMGVPLTLVRVLNPNEVGTFKIFFLYVMMIPTFSLVGGLINGLGYWAGLGEMGLKAIRLSNGFVLELGVALSLVCLAVFPWCAGMLHLPKEYGLYFAFCAFGSICSSFLEESAMVTNRIWFGAFLLSIGDLVRAIAILVTALVSHNLQTVILVYGIISLVKVSINVWLAKRLDLLDFRINWPLMKSVWKYSVPVSIAALFGVMLMSGDQLVLSHVLNPADFAIYALGCLSVPPLLILEHSVTRVMIPRISKAFADGDSREAAYHFRGGIEQLAWLLIPASAFLFLFCEPIVQLLFTSRYAAAAHYLRWYSLSYILLILPHDVVPRARGEGHWILKTFVMFSIVPLVLCGYLGIRYGAFGALTGILVARALLKVYAVTYVKSSTYWTWDQFIPFESIGIFSAVTFLLGVVCIGVRPSILSGFGGSGLAWLITSGLIFLFFYFPLVQALVNWRRRSRAWAEGETGRVLLFSQHLAVGGLERIVLSLGQTLQREYKWKVFIFSHDSSENADNFTDQTLVGDFLRSEIPVDAHKKGSGISFVTLYRLIHNIHKNQIDVIHSHDMGTLIYAVLANFLSLGRVRIVHTQHSFVHLRKFRRYALYERIFTTFVSSLTVVDDTLVKSYLDLGVSEKRISVVPNGASFAEVPVVDFATKLSRRKTLLESLGEADRATLDPLADTNWILYLARFHSVKGQRDAAGLWKNLSPEVRRNSALILVGPEAEAGERAEVMKRFESIADRERVVFIDGTKNPKDWLMASDVFLSCSRFEGMPVGPLEAVGSGVPAVLSAISGHGFLKSVTHQFDPMNPREGAALLEKILNDPSFRTQGYYSLLWERAHEIRAQYSVDKMAERYTHFYLGTV